MAVPVKIQYLVGYRVLPDEAFINCRITTTGLKELHRVLVEMTAKRLPVGDWAELVVHETVEGQTKEYGKVYLGLMFDKDYTFQEEEEEIVAEPPKKGLSKPKRAIVITTPDTIMSASFICY